MNASILKSAAFAISIFSVAAGAQASDAMLSEMTAAEIISTLPPSSMSDENKAAVGNENKGIEVNGHDLLTKAYGTINSINSREGAVEMAEEMMNITPVQESNRLWLDTADGYNITYNGMTPDVAAAVHLVNDSISDYGFFFMFPYSDGEKDRIEATNRQVAFSTSMLQEFEDMGMDLGANAYTKDLFEVSSDYSDNYVALRLIDDEEGERYILFLCVEPNALSAVDRVAVD